jgi:hypothetical protein
LQQLSRLPEQCLDLLPLFNSLSRKSSVGVATIRRAELSDDETSMTAANDLAVRRALQAAGIEFIDENGGGPGVRLREPAKEKPRK